VRGRYQARLVEYVRATAWLGRRSRVSIVVGLVVLAGAAMATGVALAYPDDLVLWVSAGAGIVLGVALVSGWSCAPGLWLAARRNRRIYEQPTEIEADTAGVTMKNGVFVTTARWTIIRRLRENDAYFFLDNGVGAAILVPKRAFDPVGAVRFGTLARAGVAARTAPRPPDGAGTVALLETADRPVAREAAHPPPGSGPDGAVVRGSFTMTVGEYGRASAWLMRRAASSWIVGLGLVGLGVFQVVAWGAADSPITAAIAVGTVGTGIALATGLVARPILWLAGRRRRDLFTQPTTIVATAAGIRMTSPLYDNVLAWDSFERIRASREHLYLEAGGGQSVVVPLRAFEPPDLRRILELAATARA
jgi:hypothetical protein